MPFKSEKQRKWMHANEPKIAKKWEKKKDESSKEYGKSLKKIANDKKLKAISSKDKELLKKLAKLLQKEGFADKLTKKMKKHKGTKVKKTKPIKLRGLSGRGKISHFGMEESAAEKEKIFNMLVKRGDTPTDARYEVDKSYDFVKKRFKKASVAKKAEIISALSKYESVNEAMSESQRFKVYNSLKKGDIVSIKYDSSIQKGTKYIPYVVTKGKTKLMKGKIERIILKNPSNPRFKAYLYNRDGDVSLALGDMAASIVDMKKGKVKESVFDLDEACQKGYMTHPTRKTKIMFGKRYRNCVKKEGVDTTMTMEQAGMIADNICVNCGDFTNENLKKWFSDRWVNIGKKKKGGGHPPCGSSGKKRGYAKCVPASKAANMSKKQKASATRRKRAAQNKAGRGGTSSLRGGGKKPIRVSTKPKK